MAGPRLVLLVVATATTVGGATAPLANSCCAAVSWWKAALLWWCAARPPSRPASLASRESHSWALPLSSARYPEGLIPRASHVANLPEISRLTAFLAATPRASEFCPLGNGMREDHDASPVHPRPLGQEALAAYDLHVSKSGAGLGRRPLRQSLMGTCDEAFDFIIGGAGGSCCTGERPWPDHSEYRMNRNGFICA
jgi:hypothetical protein